MSIVASMGFLAVMGSQIEIIYLAYYGVMVTINGIFDVMVIGEHYHRGYLDFTHQHMPVQHIIAMVVVLSSPFVEFLSGYFSYRLFKEADDAECECQPLLQERDATPTFRPFEGKPHTLGDDETPAEKI